MMRKTTCGQCLGRGYIWPDGFISERTIDCPNGCAAVLSQFEKIAGPEIDYAAAVARFDRIPVVGRPILGASYSENYSERAGGVFGLSIQIGYDVRIQVFPNVPWSSAKIQFFEALAAMVGGGLSANEQARALAILIETLNAEPEHDEGGWITLHTMPDQ